MKHLYACLNANQFLFSSQTKILIILTTLLKDKDPVDELQRDFILHKWVIRWQMKFCAEKIIKIIKHKELLNHFSNLAAFKTSNSG